MEMANVIEKVPYDEEGGNLAANCGQIFAKGPQITKDIVAKVTNAELGNDRTFLCGHEFQKKHIWMLAGLFILFSFSFLTSILLCFTSYPDTLILRSLIIQNGSDSYNLFVKPAIGPYIGVHIFNYTNVDDFERRLTDKLQVQDVGPYVFQEKIERVNVVINNDGTISFQEKRSYDFKPEMSNGLRQSDQFYVPNLPMLGTVAMVRELHFMARMGVASVFQGLNTKAFIKVPAHGFIWGYDDSFFSLVKSLLAFQRELPFEKFGLLASKNGISKDKITIDSGMNDLNNIGKVVRLNGENKMSHWSTEDCNSIDGTLGAFFSPYTVMEKKPLSLYQKDLCRKLVLDFEEEVTLMDSYNAYRYSPPANNFAHPDYEPKNQCYCHLETGTCPPHGIINATPCAFGPAYLSFPHFLYGDEKLHQHVNGLQPKEDLHKSFIDVHPTFGYAMAGWTRLQLNMLVRTSFGIPQVDIFEDETMLPIAWFDSGLNAEDMPEQVKDIFNFTSKTLPMIKTILKYGSLLMTIVTFLTIFIIIQGRLRSRRPIRTMGRRIPPFQRNISGLSTLIN